MKFPSCTNALTAVIAALITAPHGAAAQFQDSGQQQWQKYHDPRFKIALDYPAGWQVQVDQHAIIVRSADSAAFALIENFTPPHDDTPEDYIDSLPRAESRFFPGAHVDEAYTEPAKNGNEKEESGVGTISFLGNRGPARARVLTRIYPSGGILFAVAAPGGSLPATTPTLLHILQSVNFGGGGSATEASANAAAPVAPAASIPVGLDPLTAVKYKRWTDPNEAAFSYEVPVGWKVDGGSYRYAPLDIRQSIIVRSPHDEMAFMLGDASLPLFTLPSPTWMRLGYRDGAVQNVVGKPQFFMHFMPAEEFNHWYFDNVLAKDVDDLEVGETIEHPEDAQKMIDFMNKQPGFNGHSFFSIAGTKFTGRSKLNGRQMAGILYTTTSRYVANAQGDGNFRAEPQLVVWATGDSKADERKDFIAAVKRHVNQSFKFSKEWAAKQQREGAAFLAANKIATRNAIAAIHSNMAAMAQSHRSYMSHQDDRRESMMGSFKAQMAAKDNMTRKMQNYSLDQTDVRDSSGQSWKVPSGYSNYYHNGRAGVVVGTNSPANPGGEFSALTQY